MLYSVALHFYALSQLPKFLSKKGRSLGSYFGKGFPKIDKGSRKLYWIHAVSMGETKAIAGLVRRIKTDQPDTLILFSSVTTTGHAEAQSMKEVDYAVYLPFDLPYVIGPIVKQVAPDCVILCETDFWPNFLTSAKKCGAKIYVVNAKISAKSAKRYGQLPFLQSFLRPIDLFCVQDETYARRFEKFGVPQVMTGNLKFDNPPPQPKLAELRNRLKISRDEHIVTIGSTHDPEEALLLERLDDLKAKILLVPRHPERFDSVADLLKKRGVKWGRYSQPDALTGEEQVVLIDAMGVLSDCYALSDVAIVAGSFIERVGGHNLLEPVWHGVPTLFGPHTQNQPHMTELMPGSKTDLDHIHNAVKHLLHPSERLPVIARDEKMLTNIRGSLERTYKALGFNPEPDVSSLP